MTWGGARKGAGRKPAPKKKAAAAEKAKKQASREPHGYTAPDGQKTADAPKDWPFGTTPPGETEQFQEKTSFSTPIEYWEHVLADPTASASSKHAAAFALAPYVHAKLAPAAKKEEAASKAKKAASGKFAPKAPPRLVVNNP